MVGEIRSDGTQVLYAYGPEGVVAERTIVGTTAQPVHFTMLDGLGSVRHLTDGSGNMVRSITYDAWGAVRHSTGSAWTRLGYTGEPMGMVDGTIYLRARHYNPALGRFVQRDSFPGIPERPQSLNRFVYTEGNPINWTDPSGHIVPVLLAIWAVAEVALQIYDTYETAKTVLDPCVPMWEKGITLGLYIGGALLPGGGYGTAGKQVVSHLDEAADAGKAAFRVLDDALAEGVEHSANKADEAGELIEAVVEQCLRNSFSADTLVSTASGLRPISQVAVGELVLAWDATTRATGYYTVTAVMLHTDAAQVHLRVGGEHVETTPAHPFFTLERGWVAAGDLWDGAHVRRADGSYALTLVLWLDAQPQVMYNLTVATAHTFFVGVERALVHNAPRCLNLKHYDIVPYGEDLAELNKVRKSQGLEIFEKHHGVLNKWGEVQLNGLGYIKEDAPSILVTLSEHNKTREVYRQWLEQNYGRPVGVSPDWKNMSAQTAQSLADSMFEAAGIPESVRRAYFQEWNKYLYGKR